MADTSKTMVIGSIAAAGLVAIVAIMGIVPQTQLAGSSSPFADAAGVIGMTLYPAFWNARTAMLPNLRRLFDAPMTATVFM